MKFEEIIENSFTRATHPGYSNPFSGILHPELFLKHSNTQVERNEFYSRAPLNPLERSSSRIAPNNNHRQ